MLMELVGLEMISLAEKSEGFEVLNYLNCLNWVRFYIQFLEFKMDMQQNGCSVGRNELYLNTNDKTVVPGYFRLYKQIYFETKNNCIHESFLVFYKD